MNTAVQKKADKPHVWEKPIPETLSMMQPRGTSVHPYIARLQQDHQFVHRNFFLSPMQQNRPMKEESCQQPSQLLSPSVVSLEQRNRIQNARLQGSSTSSTSPCSLTLIGDNKHCVQSPMTSTKASSAVTPQEQGSWFRNARLQGHLMPSVFCSQSLIDDDKCSVQSALASSTIPSAKLQRSAMSSALHNFPALVGENKLCAQLPTAGITSSSVFCSQEPRYRVQNARLQGSHMSSTSRSQTLIGENKHCVQAPMSSRTASSAVISQEQRNPIQNTRIQGSPMSSSSLKHGVQSPIASTTAPSAIVSQEQIKHISTAKSQGSSKSSTPLNSAAIIGEGKHSIQSPIKSTTSSSAYAMFPVAEDMDLSDWKPLIIQFQRARSLYLPQLIKLYKRAKERFFQGQNVPNKSDPNHPMIKFFKSLCHIIQFLDMPEGDLLTRFSKEKVHYGLNKIAEFCSLHLSIKNIISGGSQVPQPMSSCPQPSSLNSPICSDGHANNQEDKETLACQVPKGTVDNYAHQIKPIVSESSNENQPPKVPQSRKRKKLPTKEVDYMSSMFPPKSSKLPRISSVKPVQKKNTSFALDLKATAQPKTMKSTVDSPSTSVSPSFVSKEIEKPAKQPLERLIHAVQSMSKEALRSSIDDIASVMMVVDKLPENANNVDSRSANHLHAVCCCSTSGDRTPHKHMKHDFESVGSYVSMLDNSGYSTNSARNKLDHSLMNEIREINQRLIETLIELDSDSHSNNAIIIKCTYKPVPSNVNLARHVASNASLTSLSIKFLIPSDYPSSPPQILDDRLPVGSCKESIDWMEMVNSLFDRRLRGLVSLGLGEMAQAWDDTARSVYSDFVVSLGGGSFSSMYGTWECVPAT